MDWKSFEYALQQPGKRRQKCVCAAGLPSSVHVYWSFIQSDPINRNAGGSGRVRRTVWESHTSVNKPKRLRAKKECFREWFQQILDPRVAYPWVICNPPHPPSQGCVRGKEVIEWTSKKWDQQKYAVLIFPLLYTPIHTSDVPDTLWMLNTWGKFRCKTDRTASAWLVFGCTLAPKIKCNLNDFRGLKPWPQVSQRIGAFANRLASVNERGIKTYQCTRRPVVNSHT